VPILHQGQCYMLLVTISNEEISILETIRDMGYFKFEKYNCSTMLVTMVSLFNFVILKI
jgi:hypothetical protein